jgi:hypothetical protein
LTLDVDVVYDRSPENMSRLADALAPYEPYPRGAPTGLPFRWDATTLERGLNFTLVTTLGDLDLLGEIAGGGQYDQLAPHASTVTVYGMVMECIDLPTLIHLKRAAGRAKDFEAVAELEALLAERRGSGNLDPGPSEFSKREGD